MRTARTRTGVHPTFIPPDPYNAFVGGKPRRWSVGFSPKRWFEWWYFKVFDPKSERSFYFAYGVVNPSDGEHTAPGTHAFLAAGAPGTGHGIMKRFPVTAFSASHLGLDVRIRDNRATANRISGEAFQHGSHMRWDLQVENQWHFNMASVANRLPWFSNIFWHPAQIDARISGVVECNGETYHLENAPGYQDHNWGHSYPAWWVWMAANHFEGENDSAFVLGGGCPLALGRVYVGDAFGLALRHRGKEYVFRTTSFHSFQSDISLGRWSVEACNRRHRVRVYAEAAPVNTIHIAMPTPSAEVFHNFESLGGQLRLELAERRGSGEWITQDVLHSTAAGLEFGASTVPPVHRHHDADCKTCEHLPEHDVTVRPSAHV